VIQHVDMKHIQLSAEEDSSPGEPASLRDLAPGCLERLTEKLEVGKPHAWREEHPYIPVIAH
jgi:hypothetical protein